MKPVLILTILFFAFVLSRFPAAAQEHVDVPLPPYDPPPAASHHSESHLISLTCSPKAHAKPKVSSSHGLMQKAARQKAQKTKSKVTIKRRVKVTPQFFPLALATLARK